MIELHVCDRKGTLLRAYALGDSSEVIIGRDETCDVRIAAKSVSREHCAIERSGEKLTLRDLGSTSGTYLGPDRITSVPIRDGLEIVVGPAVLRFHENDI